MKSIELKNDRLYCTLFFLYNMLQTVQKMTLSKMLILILSTNKEPWATSVGKCASIRSISMQDGSACVKDIGCMAVERDIVLISHDLWQTTNIINHE